MDSPGAPAHAIEHPYIRLLRHADIRMLWSGLAVSAVGSELYGFAALWLAVQSAGADGSLLATGRFAAILLTTAAAGLLDDHLSRRVLLIGVDLLRAMLSAIIVAVALLDGLGLSLLLLTSTLLAALGALYQPALQSGLPGLSPRTDMLRETNGLFEATARLAQAIGPFLAGLLAALLPVVHLLTLNALSYLASVAALVRVGNRLDAAATPARLTVRQRLMRGIRAARECPGAWQVLGTTTMRAGAYALGFAVGVPLFFAQAADPGSGGLAAAALALGAAAIGELLANAAFVAHLPRDPWRLMFGGYATIGAGLASLGLAEGLLPPALAAPAIVLVSLLIGVGNAIAGLQMPTFFGTRMAAGDFGAVLRLRLALVTAAAAVSTALGPWLFPALGVPGVVMAGGIALSATAMLGLVAGEPSGSTAEGES